MDRRLALKKLGMGGAVAVAAPALLDSFNVAHASSSGLPPEADVVATTIASITDKKGPVIITLNTGEFPPGTTFYWHLVTTNPPHEIDGNAAGSSVQVKKRNGNVTKFVIDVTATMPNGGHIATYRLSWNKHDPHVVS